MHFGATLRLLRIESGLGLRDLARRLGVSSTYLSRVENGIDPVPTPERIEAIARELDVPVTLLMEVAHRLSPYVAAYVEQVPAAGTLFLEIARRGLDAREIRQLNAIVEKRFSRRRGRDDSADVSIAEIVTAERVVPSLSCTDLDDALDIAAARLAESDAEIDPARLAAAFARREREQPSALGEGVAMPRAYWHGARRSVAVVTLARPMRHATPDGKPLRLVVASVSGDRSRFDLMLMAHVARLAARGLADAVAGSTSPTEVLARIAELEDTG